MNGTEPTTADKVAILKHLIAGRETDWIVAAGHTEPAVTAVKRDHGYPDEHKMRWALDILEKRATGEQVEKASTPLAAPLPRQTRTTPTSVPRMPTPKGSTGSAPSVSATTSTPPALASVSIGIGYAIAGLVQRAQKSTKASTRRLGERLADAAKRLEEALDAEEKAKAAAAAKAREDAEKKRKIAELEAQLAALRGGAKRTTAAAPASDAQRIRAWAADNGVECPAFGRVPRAVRDAYDAAQEGAA